MVKKNKKGELDRFAGIQKILLFSLLIVAVIIFTVNVLPQTDQETGGNISILDPAVQVRQEDNSLFGNIKITVEDHLSLPYARVLINGENSGDFKSGELLVRVYPGDVVSIDGSAYKRELSFDISAISSNISEDYLQLTVYTQGNIEDAGIIVFR